MNSIIAELYEVAKEFAGNPEDCSTEQHDKALAVIECVEEGEYQAAIDLGLVY